MKSFFPFELIHQIPDDGARDNLFLPEYNKDLPFPIHIQEMYRREGVNLWDKFFFDSTHWEPGYDLFCQFRGVYSMRKGKNIYYNFLRWSVIEDEKELPYRGLAFGFTPIDAYTIYNFFGLFKVFNAYALWVVMLEVLLYLSVYLSRKLAIIYSVDKNLVSSLWLLYSPVYVDLYMGQAGIIVSFLIMLCIFGAAYEKMKWLYIGFITSFLYKLTTVFFTPVLLRMRKYWLLIISFAALILSFYLAYLDHPDNFKNFWYQLAGWEVAPYRGDFAVKELLYFFFGMKGATIISRILLYTTFLIASYISLKGKNFEPSMLFAFWSSAYFLLNLRIWEHHFVIILPAIVYGYMKTRSKFLIVMFVILALPTPYVFFNNAPWTTIKHMIYFSTLTIPAVCVFIYLLIYHLKKGFVPFFPIINK
ncbi:DUF2029 domain-containing protein [bacterium]|nr:DUF2029 domain-containing protein [bacterium]